MAAVYAVDPSSASVGLVGYEQLSSDTAGSGSVWCWQIGTATCMLMCSLLRRDDTTECAEGEAGETRLWSEYCTVQQLLKDRTLAIKGSEWSGREELKLEVQTVQSLHLDDEHDRRTLRQYENDCPMLREALHKTERNVKQTGGSSRKQETRKLGRVLSAGEAGEVKYG